MKESDRFNVLCESLYAFTKSNTDFSIAIFLKQSILMKLDESEIKKINDDIECWLNRKCVI